MRCPKCGSENVSVQAVTHVKTAGRHGCLYWLFVGWWLQPILWLIFTLPMIIIAIFSPKRVKSKTHSEAVCQNCGKRWRA